MADSAFVDAAWREGLAPEPQLTVSEWADTHRLLPSTSAEPGRWRTDRTPYLRGIMDALSTGSPFERVVFMKAAQIGGTEAGLNWLGYIIHHAPGLALAVMPSLDMVKRNSRTRIDPMLEVTPVLRERIAPARSRDAGNTMSSKAFPGGQLVMTGANSASGLRSTPARYLFLDEVDGYPADADGEGDPVDLAVKRTATFRGRRKIFLCSTPTVKGESRIEDAYRESDQRRFFVPCPQCGDMAPLTWPNLTWPDDRRAEAYMVCAVCGGIATERDKPAMLAAGEWRATAKGDGRTAGFHLSALASPFVSWGEIAEEHSRVKSDPARLQVWVNTALGECWEDLSGQIDDVAGLAARREAFGDRLPQGVAALTAGVDVQDDRLEMQVVGWGGDEESWIIGHHVLWGDPSGRQVWDSLDQLLAARYPHSRAVPDLPIRAACVDSGGSHTSSVYRYCSERLSRRVYAIKGRGGAGIVPWPRKPSRGKVNNLVFIVGVDGLKDTLAARLQITDPGPGRIHFSDQLGDDFFAQLTAERRKIKYVQGRPVRSWVPRSDRPRNEALDCFVYSSAALHSLYAAGLQLNREAAQLAALPSRDAPGSAQAAKPRPSVIRSAWLDR